MGVTDRLAVIANLYPWIHSCVLCEPHDDVRSAPSVTSPLPLYISALPPRDFPLACRGLGVRPPLELSHHMVRFGATALGDGSVATLHLSHPGSKGPRLFSFSPPQESEISVVPRAGRLLPGEVFTDSQMNEWMSLLINLWMHDFIRSFIHKFIHSFIHLSCFIWTTLRL